MRSEKIQFCGIKSLTFVDCLSVYFKTSVRHRIYLLSLTIAWRSTWGFQSESYKITTSAVARLMPRPPARVLNMKTNFVLFGSLYALMDSYRHKINVRKLFYLIIFLSPLPRFYSLVSHHGVSAHPIYSSHNFSTCNNLPKYPIPSSSDWRLVLVNLSANINSPLSEASKVKRKKKLFKANQNQD